MGGVTINIREFHDIEVGLASGDVVGAERR